MDNHYGQHSGPGGGAPGNGTGATGTVAPSGPAGEAAGTAAVVAAADPEVGALLSVSAALERVARNSRGKAAGAVLEVVGVLGQVPASARPVVREVIGTLDALEPEASARVVAWLGARYGGAS